MFTSLIATVGLLMALMAAWIEVQRAARRVAEQHPEAGPLRLVGGGCGGHGHGDEAAPAPGPKRPAVTSEPAARLAVKPAVRPAEGCGACDNTACKPGAPTADGSPAFHPKCPD